MKLKVRSPPIPREFLLPVLILLNSPLPVLLPLDVLAPLLRIRFQPERFSEPALLLEPHKVTDGVLGPRRFFDYRDTVCERRRPL